MTTPGETVRQIGQMFFAAAKLARLNIFARSSSGENSSETNLISHRGCSPVSPGIRNDPKTVLKRFSTPNSTANHPPKAAVLMRRGRQKLKLEPIPSLSFPERCSTKVSPRLFTIPE